MTEQQARDLARFFPNKYAFLHLSNCLEIINVVPGWVSDNYNNMIKEDLEIIVSAEEDLSDTEE